MNRALLEQPFAPEQIRQRQGNFGQSLDYIEGHSVIQRLNDAFDGAWSFVITSQEIIEQTDEVIVQGQLSAEQIVKTQFGSAAVTRNKTTGQIICLADDLKAAATDCLKKCATLFGVGLYLYGEPARPAAQESTRTFTDLLSPKQMSFIQSLAQERTLTRQELNDQCRQRFGKDLAHLSRNDASRMIEHLLAGQETGPLKRIATGGR